MNWLKKYRIEIAYTLLLIAVVFNRSIGSSYLMTRLVSIIALTAMSYFLDMRFKMVNTFILALSIYVVSSRAYGVNGYDMDYWSVAIALLLYIALIMNIFLVIKDMYLLKSDPKAGRNGFKLLYVLSSFLLLIGTVVISYSHIYMNIWRINSDAFSLSVHEKFPAFYYSSTTYFTVGFGEITPVSELARNVTISQMFFGYMITCLIIPTVLVAFQRLFQNDNRNS